ncbi:MAG: flagellar biosynthetic protein FliQ [Cyanobacteria bacterium HKST-UBA05]|nr:flagellar biosynthetic protein FliQ [Cyanobacteria bacterium HKST-UBA05]
MELFMNHTGQGLFLILLLSMPCVLTAAAVGLVVGIVQAVTQVQEQTITAAPKIALVFLLLIFGGPMMMKVLKDYMYDSVRLGVDVVPGQDIMAMPSKRLAGRRALQQEAFFNDHNAPPGQSKLKQFINSPSAAKNLTTTDKAILSAKSKQAPKLGVGEKVYMKRRNDNTLPKPPKR